MADLDDCEVLTLHEARRLLGMGTNKAYELARADQFPGQLPRTDARYRISRRQLLAWLETASAGPDEGDAA